MRGLRINFCPVVLAALFAAGAALSSRAARAPWDRGNLLLLAGTNAPGKITLRATPREALAALQNDAPTSLVSAVLGNGQALYSSVLPTNLPPDAKTMEQERNFFVLLKNVDAMTRTGRAEEAINLLKEQLTRPMPPLQRAKINNRIASYYFKMQRYPDALPFMREAVRLNALDVAMLSNLAAVLMSMNELKEADYILKNVDPQTIREPKLLFSFFFNRACLSSLNKFPSLALNDLRKSAEADPHSTLASLGDPQLDYVRPNLEFLDLKARLETIMAPSLPTPMPGAR